VAVRGHLRTVGDCGIEQLVTPQVPQKDDALRPLDQAARFLMQCLEIAASHGRGLGQAFNDRCEVGDFAFDHQRRLTCDLQGITLERRPLVQGILAKQICRKKPDGHDRGGYQAKQV